MKVELYNNSQIPGSVELISYMGEDGLTPVNAARASFGVQKDSLDDRDRKLLKYCMKEKHTSIFEHNTITFRFKVPLFVARQHMRHRTWSFNEISRRYTSVDLDFYLPNSFRSPHDTNRQASISDSSINPVLSTLEGEYEYYNLHASEVISEHTNNSIKLFNQLIEANVCREQARMILPQNMYTTYWGTVNLNNLIKFIELRDHEGAQVEIQEMARACREIAMSIWPETFTVYNEVKNG